MLFFCLQFFFIKPINPLTCFFVFSYSKKRDRKKRRQSKSTTQVTKSSGKKKEKKRERKKKLWRLRRCNMMQVYNSKKQNHFLDISFVNARFLDSVTNHDEKRSMFFRCMDLLRRE